MNDGSYKAQFGTAPSSPLLKLDDALHFCHDNGAGEIIFHHTARDGTRSGFDKDFFATHTLMTNLPTIALGGGSTGADLQRLFKVSYVAGAALGSSLIYAPNTRQVLINYNQFKSSVFKDT